MATAQTVNPGFDVYAVEDNSWLDLSSCVIPADFFFPGSDPFNGVIDLGPDWSEPIDVIIERTEMVEFPLVGSVDHIQIEIVDLSLRSINPISVTFGGNVDSFFDVIFELDPISPPPTGEMKIELTDALGGTYEIPTEMVPLQLVDPVIMFTQVGNPANEILFDIVGTLGTPLSLGTPSPGSWEFNPTRDQLVIPGVTGPEFYPYGPLILEGDGLYLELSPATVPSPATGWLLILGLLGLGRRNTGGR